MAKKIFTPEQIFAKLRQIEMSERSNLSIQSGRAQARAADFER
ncbi:MAG TPA: hypothetical protein VHE58_05535 [Burkholderiales bacterium]|nr:hypothetical protein [Burkholderiales bacterium]